MRKNILIGLVVIVGLSISGCQQPKAGGPLSCAGKKDGTISQVAKSGLFDETQCKKGKRHGFARTYWPNKTLAMEFHFKNGIQHGKYMINHKNGKLKLEGYITNGKNEGIEKVYNKHGKISVIRNYKNGKLEGVLKAYFDDGRIQAEIVFENGYALKGFEMVKGEKKALVNKDFDSFGFKHH